MYPSSKWTRRDLFKLGIVSATTVGAWPLISGPVRAGAGTINFADIGVGDPGGDWSRYTKASGWNVNLVAIGNAPSAILNTLVAGGGTASYDVINIVGGHAEAARRQQSNRTVDTGALPDWAKDKNIGEFLAKGKPGFNFIGYQDKVYGVPTVLQGDSFAYLPEKTGALNSYSALFDPKWKGYVALEDNYTTAGQKTALYLKHANLAKIDNPDDMTRRRSQDCGRFPDRPEEEGPVPRHLVVLPAGGRPHRQQGSLCHRLLGADGVRRERARVSMPSMPTRRRATCCGRWRPISPTIRSAVAETTKAAYQLLDFMLGGWYGAKITRVRGYMTNTDAPIYAKAHPDEFPAGDAREDRCHYRECPP